MDLDATGHGAGTGRARSKGFFRSLLDLSFTSFVTAKVIKFIYVVSVVLAMLYALFVAGSVSTFVGGFASASSGSNALGVVAGAILFLVLAPLLLLPLVTYARVLLEIVIVLFRISEDTAEIARRGRAASGGANE